MPKRRRPSSLANPAFAWGLLALRTAEMMMSSGQVILHRANRKNSPAQLFEMGSEKVQASIEASHAMARSWMAASPGDAFAIWSAWPHLLASGMKPFQSRVRKNARRASRR